jgi:A/G-specific adenine glycosylase
LVIVQSVYNQLIDSFSKGQQRYAIKFHFEIFFVPGFSLTTARDRTLIFTPGMNNWFTKKLQRWYAGNKRDLPWRHERDPYRIWLSEVILQQTRVRQGLPYYFRFIEEFPEVKDLAKAHEDKVLKIWQGLGYYSRARNLHGAAKQIMKKHNGVFPAEYNDIRGLPGIGEYTASAISSFAFGAPRAVADGNVFRLLSRLFDISDPVDSSGGIKKMRELAQSLLDKSAPALHNQAIMEFGALYCLPRNPSCISCIFSEQCLAFARNRVEQRPVKGKKKSIRTRYLNYVLIADKKSRVLVQKRNTKDIWKGLYEFTLFETDTAPDPELLLRSAGLHKLTGRGFSLLHVSEPYRHLLTHQELIARFYVLRTKQLHKKEESVDADGLLRLALPRLLQRFLQDFDLGATL